MSNALALLMPMAMMLPAIPADDARVQDQLSPTAPLVQSLQDQSDSSPAQAPVAEEAERQQIWFPFIRAYRPLILQQTRVQGRIVIRVSARRPTGAAPIVPPRTSAPTQQQNYREVKMGKCVTANRIAWMQPDNQRLIFVMNNRTLVSARLNKKCRARDFYSGFYVERRNDGKICIKRDELQSRAGSKCKLRSFRQLVRNAN